MRILINHVSIEKNNSVGINISIIELNLNFKLFHIITNFGNNNRFGGTDNASTAISEPLVWSSSIESLST